MRSFIVVLTSIFFLIACTNHGDKVVQGNIEVFYKDGVSKEEAMKTAILLYSSQQKESTSKDKSLQLTKKGDTIHLRMVIDEAKVKEFPEEAFLGLGNIISDSIFGGKPVNVDLTDNKFNTLRTVYYRDFDYIKETEQEFGNRLTAGHVELFNKNISTEEAQRLVEFLNRYVGTGSNGISFQISRPDNGYYTLNMVSDEKSAADLTIKSLKEFSQTVSDSAFNGAPLILNLVDDDMKPIRTYNYNIQSVDTVAVQ